MLIFTLLGLIIPAEYVESPQTIHRVQFMEVRLFSDKFSFPLVAFLLLTLGVLPSSSGADDSLFARSQLEIERLWSGVLGCADAPPPPELLVTT